MNDRLTTLDLDEHVLPADLIGAALLGPHRALALGDGRVVRYPPEIGVFASLGTDEPDAESWATLTALPGELVALVSDEPLVAPEPWTAVRQLPLLLMEGSGATGGTGEHDAEIVTLSSEDVPEMLDLIARTDPGPFLPRTIELGGYVGIRRDGALVSMAGRRMNPPGWIEVSAVCTDPAHRGAGLARRVITAVVDGIRADGAQPFLHAVPSNPAVKLYESLGFSAVRERMITALQRTS